MSHSRKNNNNNKKDDDDELDLRDLIHNLSASLKSTENSLKNHFDDKLNDLSVSIQENKMLITKASNTATLAYQLGSDNSKQIEGLVRRVGQLELNKKELEGEVLSLKETRDTHTV